MLVLRATIAINSEATVSIKTSRYSHFIPPGYTPMRFRLRTFNLCAVFLLLASVVAARPAGAETKQELAELATGVLKKHCYRCHGVNFEAPGLDVNNRASLLRPRVNQAPYITVADLKHSLLWERMGVEQDMPPERIDERPTADDIAVIKRWIEAGAPFPERRRQTIDEKQVLQSILKHLRSLRPATRTKMRYFSLASVHNNPSISAAGLRLHRAALVKLLNSLSRNAAPVKPLLIDGDNNTGVVFALDLREVNWTTSQWRKVLKDYPYAIKWKDSDLQDLTADIDREQGGAIQGADGIPYVRVDWFVRNASRPPHYHNLLGIPATVQELEKELKVNVNRDFIDNRLQRAGFAGSGVSRHNRLVDRHPAAVSRYYYRSYDFEKSIGRGVIARFPLGPDFEGNRFKDFAFEHAGGEIIFSLANGMQGYMLVDNQGKRINDAPIRIVRDLNESSGSPVVVNGISCMVCHRHGLLDYKDSVRTYSPLGGDAQRKLQRLYATHNSMNSTLEKDRSAYMNAWRKIAAEYLQLGDDKLKDVKSFPEPTGFVARMYDKDVTAEQAAAELAMPVAGFNAIIQRSQSLLEFGLGPLPDGGGVPRQLWDSLDEARASVYQRTCTQLNMGAALSPNN